ncbi:DUF3108 domain-containing protein [Labilibacter sediminis]|nr:DUF3108 domain-containing protein [Labilibacter sediminis]
MNKRIPVSLLFMFVVISGVISSQNDSTLNTTAYQSGERLKYSLNYGFVTGGYVTFSVKDSIWNGINTNHLVLGGKSAGIVEALYKIRDKYTSFIDVETDQPVKSIRDIREGRYRYYNEVLYDYESEVEDSITIQSKRSGEVKVPKNIHDIVSAFYFARRFHFNDQMVKGEIISFKTYFGDEIFPLKIKYVGIETIKTKFGKMECYLFHPVTEVGRAFKTEEDMKLWVSRDDNRIPIKAKVNLKVGSFTCELEEFQGLRNSFSCIKK